MSYTHLSQNERYQIQCLRKGGFSLAAIGAELQRSASTISRELRRNGMAIGYASGTAQRQASRRRHAASARARIDAEASLRQDWSPVRLVAPAKPPSATSASTNTSRPTANGGRCGSDLLPASRTG